MVSSFSKETGREDKWVFQILEDLIVLGGVADETRRRCWRRESRGKEVEEEGGGCRCCCWRGGRGEVVVGFNLRRWVGGKGVGFVDWTGKIGLFG